MDVISFIKRLDAKVIWLASVLFSIVLSEGIVIPMSLLLKKIIDPDFLVTGFVTSLVVASLVTAMLIYMLETLRKSEAKLQSFEEKSSADKTHLKQSLWRHTHLDMLTGLPNRQLLTRLLRREIRKSSRNDVFLAVILINIGDLKDVNSTLGHRVGDKVILDAAKRITERIRGSDYVARLSGNEFALLLTKLTEVNHVDRIAKDLLESLKQPHHVNHEIAYLFPSIGIAVFPTDAGDAETLLAEASQAMDQAKNEGGGSFSYFAQSDQEERLNRLRLIKELHLAIEHNQFLLYFQPVVDMATGSILKCEALIRWQHPSRGIVNPLEFIPLAEEVGLIHDIGDWVFREALKYGKCWSELVGRKFKIGVNMSSLQFKTKGLDDKWITYLNHVGFSGDGIIIEITESLLMHDGIDTQTALLRFHGAGIEVAIDDFGTGYSSLSYLKQYHIDYLKIDQSFVRNIAQSSSDMALCEAIVSMAHKLNLKVIAEGIETKQQRDLLAAIGCDFGQGYLFSKPLPAEDLEVLLSAKKSHIYEPV
jgi:diguanylate cyclase (GGDEF)-like protein